MRWRRALIGYQAEGANEYLRGFEAEKDARARERREQIITATATRMIMDEKLDALKADHERRRARLDAVESELVNGYYRLVNMKMNPKRESADTRDRGQANGQALEEDEAMSGKHDINRSLFGVSTKDFDSYIEDIERKHDTLITDLTTQLSQLEKAIETRNDEIKAMESRLDQPEMRIAFIELAEQFLASFESVIDNAVADMAPEVSLSGEANRGEPLARAVQSAPGADKPALLSSRPGEIRRGDENGRGDEFGRGADIRRAAESERGADIGRATETEWGDEVRRGVETGRGDEARPGDGIDRDKALGHDREIDRQLEIELRTRIAKCQRRIKALMRANKRLHEDTEARAQSAGGHAGAAADSHAPDQSSDRVSNDRVLSDRVSSDRVNESFDAVGLNRESFSREGFDTESFDGKSFERRSRGRRDVSASERADELRYQYLLDKTSSRDMVSRDGEILISRGEPITVWAADRVYREGLMERLIQNIAER